MSWQSRSVSGGSPRIRLRPPTTNNNNGANIKADKQHCDLLLRRLLAFGCLASMFMYLLLSARIILSLNTLDDSGGFFLNLLSNGRGCRGGGGGSDAAAAEGENERSSSSNRNNGKSSSKGRRRRSAPDFQRTFGKKANLPSCSDSIDAKDVSYTLVTQMNDSRMWVMKHHCEAWPHKISLALLTDRNEADILADLEGMGCRRSDIVLSTLPSNEYLPSDYPVNALRNLAVAAPSGASSTSHFVNVDADFWLGTETHDALMTREVRESLADDPRRALVVPAFMLHRNCPKDVLGAEEEEEELCRREKIGSMPRTKEELARALEDGSVTVFDPKNPRGHDSTDYERWKGQAPGELEDIPCIKSRRYEPYLVVRRCAELPPFQEEFAGYGWNKISWTVHLQRAGYTFAQLGGGFLVHFPHRVSKAKKDFDKEPEVIKQTFREFVMWLSTIQNQERTPSCPSEAKFLTYTANAPSCRRVPVEDMAFTMVSQLSDNRLWLMKYQCKHWKGPMSLAIFTNRTRDSIADELLALDCHMDNTAIAILDSEKYDPADYPVNILRNMAMSGIKTSHFFYVDADFIMSENVESTLMSDSVKDVLALSSHQALVVPAFQLYRKCTYSDRGKTCSNPIVPVEKTEILEGIYRGDVKIFDYKHNPGGHGTTRYHSWMSQAQGSVELIPCFASDRYEPYLVAQYCDELPPFQEDFTGYSSDKLSWIMQLHRSAYNFYQIGRTFVIHYPHPEDKWKQKKTLKSDVRQERFEQIMDSFKSWLEELPNNQHAPWCSESQRKQLMAENDLAIPIKKD